MATATKTQTAVQDATAQAQELTERWIETSKKAAGEYLTLTEQAAQSVVEFQRQVAEHGDLFAPVLTEGQALRVGGAAGT